MSKEQSATSHEDPVAVLLRFIDGIKAEVKKTGKFSFEGESADYWITKFTLVKDALEEHEYVALEHEHLGCSVAKTGIYAPSETAPSEALKLAEQWKGRADDAGRLSRAVIESAPSEPPQKPIRRYRASVLDGYANIKEHPEGAYCLYSDVQAALASAPSTTPRSGATPRTDAALDAASLSAHETLVKLTKVSRDLERELTEAQRNGRIMVREYDALKAESALSAIRQTTWEPCDKTDPRYLRSDFVIYDAKYIGTVKSNGDSYDHFVAPAPEFKLLRAADGGKETNG